MLQNPRLRRRQNTYHQGGKVKQLMCIKSTYGNETVNVLKIEGQAKVGGTIVCVSGAILMVLFRGPALLVLGYADHEVMVVDQQGWMVSNLLTFGIDNCHIGVLCLVGNCICMAAFLAIQVPPLPNHN